MKSLKQTKYILCTIYKWDDKIENKNYVVGCCVLRSFSIFSLPDISRVLITKIKGRAGKIARMEDSCEGLQTENRKRMDKLGRLDVDCSMKLKRISKKNEHNHIHWSQCFTTGTSEYVNESSGPTNRWATAIFLTAILSHGRSR